MTEHKVPLVVRTGSESTVATLTTVLESAGVPVLCTRVAAIETLQEVLGRIKPELLIDCLEPHHDSAPIATLRDQVAPWLPILALAEHLDEAAIAAAMRTGARDAISLGNPGRLAAVVRRELRSARLEQALQSTVLSAHAARDPLLALLDRPADAIIHVQEGIVVDANPAWLALFGPDHSVVGQPVMDLFDEPSRPALKGALSACLQGRWSGHELRAGALAPTGGVVTADITLTLGEHDGQPCVQLILPAQRRDEHKLLEDLEELCHRDQSTGLLHRRDLLPALRARLAVASPGGVRWLALIKLDRFTEAERRVGATASEQLLTEFATQLRETLHPNEVAGRFGGVRFLVLLERGNPNDVQAWSRQLVEQCARRAVRVGTHEVTMTCTVGLAPVASNPDTLDAAIAAAADAYARGTHLGGNQTVSAGAAPITPYDESWVKQIKSALLENRFRLATQPVASLQGGDVNMFDVLLRMIDGRGKEVLPVEFLAAAERNDLLKNIDRWVVGAALSLAAQRRPGCLFVRLSADTVRDATFVTWLSGHLRSARADPRSVCFQVTEAIAVQNAQTRALAGKLRQWGFRFALESFGSAANAFTLIESLPLDYVKIDGALVQSLARNQDLQHHVRTLAEEAAKRGIQTIAERVEDATTMAVLWQLGIEYIQGYFVNAPEEVVLQAGASRPR